MRGAIRVTLGLVGLFILTGLLTRSLGADTYTLRFNPHTNKPDWVVVSTDISTVSLDATNNTEVLYGYDYSISQDDGFTYSSTENDVGISGDIWISTDAHITGILDLGYYFFPQASPGDNQVLKYDSATATFGWEADGGGGAVAGADTQVQYNDGGAAMGGNAGFTFTDAAGQLDVGISGDAWINTNAYVTGDMNISGNTKCGDNLDVTDELTAGDTDVNSLDVTTIANVSIDMNITGNTVLGDSLRLESGADPDLGTEGQISWDSDDDWQRGYDGTRQVVVGQATKFIFARADKPVYLADGDTDVIWHNQTGATYNITGIYCTSVSDDVDIKLKEGTDTNLTGLTMIESISIDTNGTGVYYKDTTAGIDHTTIENNNVIILDVDDAMADDTAWLSVLITGYLDGDVN
jgi:hypothetical protein